MHHGMGHLDSPGGSVENDAANLALQQWQKLANHIEILLVEQQRSGQLAGHLLEYRAHLVHGFATDENRRRAEHLVGTFQLSKKLFRGCRKQRRCSKTASRRCVDSGESVNIWSCIESIQPALVSRMNLWREHRTGASSGEFLRSRSAEVLEAVTFNAEDDPGICAKLPHAQRYGINEALRQRSCVFREC